MMKVNLVSDARGRGKVLIDGKDVTDNVKAINISVKAGCLTVVDITYNNTSVQTSVEVDDTEPRGCNIERQGDEMFCGTCGLRWAASESQPDCPQGVLL